MSETSESINKSTRRNICCDSNSCLPLALCMICLIANCVFSSACDCCALVATVVSANGCVARNGTN